MTAPPALLSHKHAHTHTHNLRKHSTKRFGLSKIPRQLVIRQDKQSMSDANRRLCAVQGAETRKPRPLVKASTSSTDSTHTHTHRSSRCWQVS